MAKKTLFLTKKVNFPKTMSLGQFLGIILMCISPIFLVWGCIVRDTGILAIAVTLFFFGAIFRTYGVIATSDHSTLHYKWKEQNFIERVGHVCLYIFCIATVVYLLITFWPSK